MTQAATMTEQARLVAKIISERLEPLLSPGAAGNAHSLCNETANAVLTALQGSAALPSEAMIEAGAAALFGVSDFEGKYAELSEMSKQIYREKSYAVLNAAMRAATPTAPVTITAEQMRDKLLDRLSAPVQDDNAKWRCINCKEVFSGPEMPDRCGSCCCSSFAKIDRLSRLSPTPDTGLIEALTPSAETKAAYIGEFSLSIEEGEYGRRIIPVPWTTIKEIMAAIRKRALANAAPAQVESGK